MDPKGSMGGTVYVPTWMVDFYGFSCPENMDQSHGSVMGKPNERLKILLEVISVHGHLSVSPYPSLPPRNKKAAFKKGAWKMSETILLDKNLPYR